MTVKEGTGVDGIRAQCQFGFHSVRHCFVTLCNKNHIPTSTIRKIVGDSHLLYTHVDASDTAEAIDALPNFSDSDNNPKPVDWGFISTIDVRQLSEGLRRIMSEIDRKTQAVARAS